MRSWVVVDPDRSWTEVLRNCRCCEARTQEDVGIVEHMQGRVLEVDRVRMDQVVEARADLGS